MIKHEGSKKEDITYAVYVQAVSDLKAQGHAASVRVVQRTIGGSHSTLLEYQRRLQADQALATTIQDTISDSCKQALLAEFGRMVQATREKLESELAQERQQIKEANELLREAESRIAALEIQYQSEKEHASEKILTLEKQLAGSHERITDQQHQLDKLEQQLKESITAQEFARTETAKSKLQLERADKDVIKAEKQVGDLEIKITELQQRAHQAEIKAAVAEARVAELEKQVAKK